MMTSVPVLQTHALSTGYPRRAISSQLELKLHAGEMIALLGPNGAGKSTLMRTLAGMQKPLGGRVSLLGDDLHRLPPAERAKRLSMVLTEQPDPGMLTGYALVALGRHPYTGWAGRLTTRDEAVVRWAVAAVGAADIATNPVGELSDGQRQKLMIARALAQEPAVLFLDEPTAFLDLPRRVEVMRLLRRLAHETGRAVLLSTHDLDLALRTADHLWLMGPDGSVRTGVPEALVLDGGFEAAFRSEGVAFDRETGGFRVYENGRGFVTVVGESDAATWTRRALQRLGYTLHEDAATRVTVDAGRWTLTTPEATEGERVFASLGGLLATFD